MATSGFINGTAMALYVNSVKCAVLIGNDLDVAFPTRETANKDDGSWTNRMPGRGNWSFSGSAFFKFLTTGGYLSLFTAMTAKQEVYALIGNAVSGDHYWHGWGYITNLPASFPDDEASTYNITIEGNGQLYFTQLT